MQRTYILNILTTKSVETNIFPIQVPREANGTKESTHHIPTRQPTESRHPTRSE